MGAGGAGLARFSFDDPLQVGPCGRGTESDPLPEGWLHRSTALGVSAEQANILITGYLMIQSRYYRDNWVAK